MPRGPVAKRQRRGGQCPHLGDGARYASPGVAVNDHGAFASPGPGGDAGGSTGALHGVVAWCCSSLRCGRRVHTAPVAGSTVPHRHCALFRSGARPRSRSPSVSGAVITWLTLGEDPLSGTAPWSTNPSDRWWQSRRAGRDPSKLAVTWLKLAKHRFGAITSCPLWG